MSDGSTGREMTRLSRGRSRNMTILLQLLFFVKKDKRIEEWDCGWLNRVSQVFATDAIDFEAFAEAPLW